MPLPLNWSNDALSEYLNNALHRVHTSFDCCEPQYKKLVCVDWSFRTICKNLPGNNSSTIDISLQRLSSGIPEVQISWSEIFLIRAHSAYRAACQLIMSGQITESAPILRLCLEYSLYALHMKENGAALEAWEQQYSGNSTEKSISSQFIWREVKPSLQEADESLVPFICKLRELTIGAGVHPNRNSIDPHLALIQYGESLKAEAKLCHSGSLGIGSYMALAAEIGLACLLVFDRVLPCPFEKFEIVPKLFKCLEISVSIDEFKQIASRK